MFQLHRDSFGRRHPEIQMSLFESNVLSLAKPMHWRKKDEVVVMQPIGIGIAVAIRDRLARAANGR